MSRYHNPNRDEAGNRIARELADGEYRIAEGREPAGELDQERLYEAEAERVTLIDQAITQHLINTASEDRRFGAEIQHIHEVYDLRISRS